MFGLCLMMAMMAAGASPAAPAAPAAPSSVVRAVPARDSAHVLLDLINQARAASSLAPLAWDDKLAAAASDHARRMAETGRLSHQFDNEPALIDRLLAHDVRLNGAAENVVYDINLENAHGNFMNSTPHRANMLNSAYDAVGIGVVELGGVFYITEDFAHLVSGVSDEEAARQVAASFANLRREAGAGQLAYFKDKRLQKVVKEMAVRGSLDGGAAMRASDANFAASFATPDPSRLPDSVARLSTLRGITHYSVAVCFARTPKYPGGLYWVTLALYSSPVTAARMLPGGPGN